MAKSPKTVDRKRVLKALKTDPDSDKQNVTFSLPKSLVSSFKKDCQKHGLTMNKVVQKLIEDYVEV